MRQLALLLSFLLLACGGGLVPDRNKDCREEGRCGVRTYASGDAMARTYVRDSADCRQSEACTVEGRCHYVPDTSDACVGLTDLDCQASERCATEGACTVDLSGRRCITLPSGCAQADACQELGLCNYKHAEGCVLEGPTDCEMPCRIEGRCDLVDGVCVAGTEQDCAASAHCKGRGRCGLNQGRCVATEAGCQDSSMCALNGWCSVGGDAESGPADWCDDAVGVCDEACWASGRCSYEDAYCQPGSQADCEGALECTLSGRCEKSGHLCAVTQAGCEASLECQAFGRCTLDWGRCVNPDAQDSARAYSCLATPECKERGACLATPDGACVTAEEAGLEPWLPPPWPGNPLPR